MPTLAVNPCRVPSLVCFFSRVLLIVILAALGTRTFASPPQAPVGPGIARFDFPTSGLEWKAAAHPLRFFDATGRRAAIFGKQSGSFEAWVYPMKLLHGFRLEFRQEGMIETLRGETLLEQVVVRPESATLVYVHPSFTVRATLWVPLEEPAIIVFFDVDGDEPLAITVKFIPDLKPMWPASLGGQHSYWLPEEKAFGLTDGTGRPTAVIGSPAVGAFTEFMDHQLIGGEMLLQLRIEPQRARELLFPLVMALSRESSAEARATYRSVLERARELYAQRVHYHRDFLARTLHLETPEPDLNAAFVWAKVALEAGWVCHPRSGCGLVAGYGPSGEGERPGFAWWFGGDALMATWALSDYGDLEGVLRAFRFLRARQRADGKMMHEMTQSADLIDWFGQYGFAYYHADTTPLYLYSLGQHWRRTGDRTFLEEFWDSAKRAYQYCLSTVSSEDGLMDNTKAGLAAVEVGPLRGKVVKDVYLEGFWLAALESMAEMAEALSDSELKADASARSLRVRESLTGGWWNPEGRFFAFGLTGDGHRADLVGNWPAVLLALSRSFDPALAQAGVEVFAWPELATDWGIRWLSNRDPLYDPVSYNNGSVWPFMSGLVAWAQYKHGQPLPGFATWSSIARLTGTLSPGAVPEFMSGDRFRPAERAVPHQLFSSVAVVVPAVRGLLGLDADLRSSESSSPKPTLRFSPRLPAHWPFIKFARFAIGTGNLRGEVLQQINRMTINLEYDGKQPVTAELAPALPGAARVRRVLLGGKPLRFLAEEIGEATIVSFEFQLQRKAELLIEYEGGIGIVPVAPQPEPGARTTELKILRVTSRSASGSCPIELTLAGLGGRTYALELVTALPQLQAGEAKVSKTTRGYRMEVLFEGSDYVTRQVCLTY